MELKGASGSKSSQDAYCTDLQARLALAVKERGKREAELRQVGCVGGVLVGGAGA